MIVTVAESGSVTKAAASLGLAQPALVDDARHLVSASPAPGVVRAGSGAYSMGVTTP